MALVPHYIGATRYRAVSDSLTILGAQDGIVGMTQLAIRASQGPKQNIAESQYNLPVVPDGQITRLEGASQGLTHIIHRTVSANSPRYTYGVPVNAGQPGFSTIRDIVLPGTMSVTGYEYPDYKGAARTVQGNPGEHVLNLRIGWATASGRSMADQTGFTRIAITNSAGVSSAMVSTIGYKELTTLDSTFRVAGGSEVSSLSEFADIYIRLVTTKPGLPFRIKVDGQLIPATPNLWSGGQLTPVGLNLPE